MNSLKFIQLNPDLPEECQTFSELMAAYNQELDAHMQRQTPTELLAKWTASIIRMQGAKDRHLELCYEGNTPIGFLYGKIDHEDSRGFKKPGYGYIMEFYVQPASRHKGYGTAMFQHLEDLFRKDGAANMYLTADPVTGVPFWTAMGFQKTDEISPENQQEIMERAVTAAHSSL